MVPRRWIGERATTIQRPGFDGFGGPFVCPTGSYDRCDLSAKRCAFAMHRFLECSHCASSDLEVVPVTPAVGTTARPIHLGQELRAPRHLSPDRETDRSECNLFRFHRAPSSERKTARIIAQVEAVFGSFPRR